jgi:hypothetical protein
MTRQRILGLVLVAASLLAVAQSARTTWEQHRYVQCQARVNDALITRTRALVEATDEERRAERAADDAERALFTDPALIKPVAQRSPADQARILAAFAAYRQSLVELDKERRDADRARAAHPVPAAPSQVCS